MINTVKNLCFVLKIDESELKTILSTIDNFYYEKVEPKFNKDGSPKLNKTGQQKNRILNPSINRLKQIQKRIQKSILLALKLPDYAFGAVKGMDNIKNAKKHQGKKYIFTTDLKDFFPSIRHFQVFEMFRSFNFSPTVSRILTQLTTYKGRLPQGAPTSSSIANLVFVKTGTKIQRFAISNQITFTSFVDDLTFSAPKDFKDKVPDIIKIIQADGFKISHSKTHYKTKNPTVTGLVVKNNNLGLTDTFKIKVQKLEEKTEDQKKGLTLYAERVKNA